MKKPVVFSVFVLLFFLVFCGVSSAQRVDLRFMTGPMGGAWYPLGGAIGDAIQKQIPGVTVAVAPGGGIANVEGIEVGRTDIGFSNSSSAVDGFLGRSPFKQKMGKMRQLANLYPQYFQIVVLEESGIRSVADLKGKIIAPGPKGFTGELLTQHVLQVHGLSYADMARVQHVGYSDAVSLMKDKHAHAYMPGTTVPASSILDLASARNIRLIPIAEDKVKALQEMNAGYLDRLIPAGSYPGVDYDVPGVGYYTHLVISADLPDDLVYGITKALVENIARFGEVVRDMQGVTARDLAFDIGVPFHPGAERYYREIGALK